MRDLPDLYPSFTSHWVEAPAGELFARAAGHGPPVLLLRGFEVADPVATWRERATDVRGHALDCVHFLPEEAPDATNTAPVGILA